MSEGYHYTGCGLDYVYLRNGYARHETEYGAGISIEDADGLHAAIADEVITSRQRLRGQEVRFLRTLLDISQAALARILGTTRVSVARWEARPTSPIPAPADRLLRVFFALKVEGDAAATRLVDLLEQMDELEHGPAMFEEDSGRWHYRPAA